MKGTGSNKASISSTRYQTGNPAARAAAFLSARESHDYHPGSGDPHQHSLPEPFRRDPGAAKTSADAIMAQVQAIGAPDLLMVDDVPVRTPFSLAGRASRLVGIAAAAVLVAALSSIITLSLIRSGTTVDVRFVLEAPHATSVWLAADFNEWSPDGYSMTKSTDGTWEITVPLRKGKAYAYNFIIDGEHWVADPSSPARLDDGFGGSSSSLSL
jgi:hypothetical protein